VFVASPANAATLFSDGSLAPGEFLSLTGFGIGPDTGVAYTPAGAQWQAPLQLAGVVVSFDGQAAPLLYVQSRQVNVLAPFELSGKASTTIQVQYNGSLVGSMTVPVNGAAPVFPVAGRSFVAGRGGEPGWHGKQSIESGGARFVRQRLGTGFGSIDPPCATGGLNPFAAVSLNSNVTISAYGALIGETVSAEYAGSAPGMACGVEQINFQVPSSAHGSTYLYHWSRSAVNYPVTPAFPGRPSRCSESPVRAFDHDGGSAVLPPGATIVWMRPLLPFAALLLAALADPLAAQQCAWAFSPNPIPTVPAAGGSGTLTLTPSPFICGFVFGTDSPSWITVSAGPAGTGYGGGSVNWTAAANLTAAPRTGNIVILDGYTTYYEPITEAGPSARSLWAEPA